MELPILKLNDNNLNENPENLISKIIKEFNSNNSK